MCSTAVYRSNSLRVNHPRYTLSYQLPRTPTLVTTYYLDPSIVSDKLCSGQGCKRLISYIPVRTRTYSYIVHVLQLYIYKNVNYNTKKRCHGITRPTGLVDRQELILYCYEGRPCQIISQLDAFTDPAPARTDLISFHTWHRAPTYSSTRINSAQI